MIVNLQFFGGRGGSSGKSSASSGLGNFQKMDDIGMKTTKNISKNEARNIALSKALNQNMEIESKSRKNGNTKKKSK